MKKLMMVLALAMFMGSAAFTSANNSILESKTIEAVIDQEPKSKEKDKDCKTKKECEKEKKSCSKKKK